MRISNEEARNPNLVTHICSAATMRFFLTAFLSQHFKKLAKWEEVREILHDFCQTIIINVYYKDAKDLANLQAVNAEFIAAIKQAGKSKAYQGFGRMLAQTRLELDFVSFLSSRYGASWEAAHKAARALMLRAALLTYFATVDEKYLRMVKDANDRMRKAWN